MTIMPYDRGVGKARSLGDDGAGRHRELHELRRVGVGQDRRRGDDDHAPVVLFALVVRRYLLRGLTTGALKG